MLQKLRNNLAIKISVMFAVAYVISVIVFSVYMTLNYLQIEHQTHYEQTARLSVLLVQGTVSADIINDISLLQDLLGVPIHQAILVDHNNIVTHATDSSWIGLPVDTLSGVSESALTLREPDGYLDDDGCTVVIRSFRHEDNDVTLYIKSYSSAIQTWLAHLLRDAFYGIVAITVFYIVVMWFTVNRAVQKPVADVVKVLQNAEQGDLSVRCDVKQSSDTIGILQRRTNALLSSQEHAHNDIEHLNKVLYAIRDVNQLIARQRDPLSLTEAVTTHLTDSGSYTCAWIMLTSSETIINSISTYPPLDSSILESETTHTLACYQEIADSESEVMMLDPQSPACEACLCARYNKCTHTMAAKLIYDNEFYGVILAAVPEQFTIDRQEITLFRAIADDVANGLFNIQNERERVSAQQALEHLRQQWQQVVNTMPVMLDAFDENGTIIAWNKEAARVTGYTAEEIIGNPDAMELFYPDLAYHNQVMESVRNPKTNFGLHNEWILTDKAGEEHVIEWYNASQYAPISMWHHWAVGIDITERIKTERALRESNQHIESLLKNPVGYVIFRLKLNRSPFEAEMVLVSPSVEEVTGVRLGSGDILTSWIRNIHPSDMQSLREGYLKGLRPPYVFDMELRYMHPVKGQRWLHVRASGMESSDTGKLQYTNGILMDITDRVETARALRESNQHIQSLLQNPVGYVMFRLKMGATPQESMLVLISPSVGDVAGVVPCEEEAITTWLRFVHPDDMLALMHNFSRITEAPHIFNMEVRYMHPQKGTLWMHIEANGVLDGSGHHVEYANGILMDITERKDAETQLQQGLERLRQAEIAAMSGFWSQDLVTDEEWWSENQYRLHGVDPADYPHPSYGLHLNRVHPDDRENFRATRVHDLAGDATYTESEFRMLLPDGTVRHILARAQIDRNIDGTAIRIMGMDQDITERKQNEQRLSDLLSQVREQAQQMRQIMDTVPYGIVLLDHSLRVQMANPTGSAILRNVSGLEPGAYVERIGDTPIANLLRPPQSPGAWHEIQSQNHIYEILARSVSTSQPERRAWLLALRDVTAERMLQRITVQQERLASVGQLAAGIAHDFNNIMAVIILYAGSLLMMKNLADSARERIKTIADQARNATTLIQQILDFSRRSALERRPMDLVPFLQGQYQLFQRTLPENINVVFNHGREDYLVNADPTSLQQVMMNLAVNARDAMPNGGTLTITLSITRSLRLQNARSNTDKLRQWVCISVQDTGHGMPDEIMEHLFEPFRTTKEPGKGSGLGLAQVHGIIGQHEGEISVESQPEMGTTFHMHLPLLTVATTEATEEPLEDVPEGNGETILVVEDNPAMRSSLVESLNLLNYKSLEAENGHEALFILSRHTEGVDMVLSDVVMPSMGGIDLFHAIQDQNLAVPMALLTGHPMGGEMDGLVEAGLRAWMTKPPTLEALARMIRKTLGDPKYA